MALLRLSFSFLIEPSCAWLDSAQKWCPPARQDVLDHAFAAELEQSNSPNTSPRISARKSPLPAEKLAEPLIPIRQPNPGPVSPSQVMKTLRQTLHLLLFVHWCRIKDVAANLFFSSVHYNARLLGVCLN
jgi:hypothetical protein